MIAVPDHRAEQREMIVVAIKEQNRPDLPAQANEDLYWPVITIPAHTEPDINFARSSVTVPEGSTRLLTLAGHGLESAVTVTLTVAGQTDTGQIGMVNVGMVNDQLRPPAATTRLDIVLPAGDHNSAVVVTVPDDSLPETEQFHRIRLYWPLEGLSVPAK